MIRRLWGGATIPNVLNQETNETANFQDVSLLKFQRNIDAKKILAKYAASLIKDGPCAFLDAGSTTSFIPEFITAKNVTVVTNSINDFPVFAKKVSTYTYRVVISISVLPLS